MTSYEFEVTAKNAVIDILDDNYKIQELHLVWFAKELKNYKCVLCDLRPSNQSIYEVTYNGDKNEMYVDIYDKRSNTKILGKDFKKEVAK